MQFPRMIGRSLRAVTTRLAEADIAGVMSRHPWITVGVGVGFGLGVGLVASRLVHRDTVAVMMPGRQARRPGVLGTFTGVLASTVAAEAARRLAHHLIDRGFHSSSATPTTSAAAGIPRRPDESPPMTH